MSKQKDIIRIAIDANFLIKLLDRTADPDDFDRMEHLLETIKKTSGSQLIIPMPSLAEYLVRADDAGHELLEKLESNQFVNVAPFDRKAAVECALIEAAGINTGDKRHGVSKDVSYQTIKVDRQIVAIAKANGATAIISDDIDVPKICRRAGLEHINISNLAYPDKRRQKNLNLDK